VRLVRSASNSDLGHTRVIFMSADASTETLDEAMAQP
jgi:hypothetical protein